MSRILAVAANTFRETIRERVLYNLLFFALVMTVSGLLLGQISIRQDEKIIKDIALAAMDLFGTAIAVFVGVGLVSKEIERRSLYPLMAKPITRDEFERLVGRWAHETHAFHAVPVADTPDEWTHRVTGTGMDAGMAMPCRWVPLDERPLLWGKPDPLVERLLVSITDA